MKSKVLSLKKAEIASDLLSAMGKSALFVYNDKRKNHRRIKWWCLKNRTVTRISNVLQKKGISHEPHKRGVNGDPRWEPGYIAIRAPLNFSRR